MKPLRVQVHATCEVEAAGLRHLIVTFPDRMTSVSPTSCADVLLYGLRDTDVGHDETLHALLRTSTPARRSAGHRQGWLAPTRRRPLSRRLGVPDAVNRTRSTQDDLPEHGRSSACGRLSCRDSGPNECALDATAASRQRRGKALVPLATCRAR